MCFIVSFSDVLFIFNGLELELSGGFGIDKGIFYFSLGSVAGGCVGVLDGFGASCFGVCGGKLFVGCWCDMFCTENEDCCEDYLFVCVNLFGDSLGVCCEVINGVGCGVDIVC